MTHRDEMPDVIYVEPKPATWGAYGFSVTDPKNGRAVRYVRPDKARVGVEEMKAELFKGCDLTWQPREAIEYTIDHLAQQHPELFERSE